MDNQRDTIWIIVGVMEMTQKEIFNEEKSNFLTIIQERTTVSIANTLKNFVLPGTYIKTDGWAAYPSAIRRCNHLYEMQFLHKIVNHTEGFINSDGTHTNTVENLWSYVLCAC